MVSAELAGKAGKPVALRRHRMENSLVVVPASGVSGARCGAWFWRVAAIPQLWTEPWYGGDLRALGAGAARLLEWDARIILISFCFSPYLKVLLLLSVDS